jgi:hypothetical protein
MATYARRLNTVTACCHDGRDLGDCQRVRSATGLLRGCELIVMMRFA